MANLNWKTTAAGLIASASSFILWAPTLYPAVHFPAIVNALAAFVQIGGFAALGLNSKDHDVTGGTRQQ